MAELLLVVAPRLALNLAKRLIVFLCVLIIVC